ncbi:MAG: bifunctional metallophosphatase/5'-nucleotidase [Pseudomonadota bacterium]
MKAKFIGLAATLLSCCLHTASAVAGDAHDSHKDVLGNYALEASRSQKAEWRDSNFPKKKALVKVKILGFNDFHGRISAGTVFAGRPAGGAAVFASYLKAAQAGIENRTFIVHAGDAVGASPLSSALLQDEPTITFFNQLANSSCTYEARMHPRCNMVGTLGNHEFDQGRGRLLHLLYGGQAGAGPSLEPAYQGAKFPYVSANVVSAQTGKPILPAYVIKHVRYQDGRGKTRTMPIAFIGAVLKETPTVVTPTGVTGLKFIDEAAAINHYIPEIRAQGVRTIIVLIHQGGAQDNYVGQTDSSKSAMSGALADIVSRLDDEIDVVVSGHTHSFTNAILQNTHGKSILVTQAFSYSTAYADIDLQIDSKSRDVVAKSASVVIAFADRGPGLSPDRAAAELVSRAERKVAPIANQLIGTITEDIKRLPNSAGESALGDLIADAHRAAMNTQVAFMNPGGMRADMRYAGLHSSPLPLGTITYNDLFSIHPFGNSLVKMDLTGQQIIELLNQQFPPYQAAARMLQVSGLTYTWSAERPAGNKVVSVQIGGLPIDRSALYSVAANSFIAAGGDRLTVFTRGVNRVGGPLDIDALIAYVKSLPQPIATSTCDRIVRVNESLGKGDNQEHTPDGVN